MKRFLLPLIMILVFCAESIYTDLVRFPFVSVEQQVVPHFLLLALIFMSAYINQKHAVIYGLIFGFLYDINYTGVLGVYSLVLPVYAIWRPKRLKCCRQTP